MPSNPEYSSDATTINDNITSEHSTSAGPPVSRIVEDERRSSDYSYRHLCVETLQSIVCKRTLFSLTIRKFYSKEKNEALTQEKAGERSLRDF